MSKKNLLQEAIADAKEIKEAAIANAQSILMEHLKENVRAVVDEQLNEALSEEASCDDKEIKEGDEMTNEENELELEELPEVAMGDEDSEDEEENEEEGSEDEDEEEGGEDEDEDLEEGLTEADLDEALQAALMSEVDHGQLGDPEDVVNGDNNDTGIADEDSKEEGWDKKSPPKSKASTLATGEKYHQESLRLKKKVAELAKENVMVKKANKKLGETIKEVKLFNAKLFYAVKLMQKEGLDATAKDKIIAKMDKVESLSEAKSLYESVQLALGLVGGKAKTEKSKPSLAEALGSKGPAGTGPGVSGGSVEDSQKTRFQALAGLKKEE